MENEYLSPAEVKSLTGGRARLADQLKVLCEEGIPHKMVGRRVVVSRHHVRQWLSGEAAAPTIKPRLDLVR